MSRGRPEATGGRQFSSLIRMFQGELVQMFWADAPGYSG